MTDKKKTDEMDEAVKGLGEAIGDEGLMSIAALLGRRLPEEKRKETFEKFSSQAINELIHKFEILRHTTGLAAGCIKTGIFTGEESNTVYNLSIECKEFETAAEARDWMNQVHEKAKKEGDEYSKNNPEAI